MELNKIYNMDCLIGMKQIESESVDLILSDLPYGTTAQRWDKHIDMTLLWQEYERIIKPNGNIVLTASQPFTTMLIHSNLQLFKYTWVWEKHSPTGFMSANHRPLKRHEDIVVFSKGVTSAGNNNVKAIYHPQGLKKAGILKRNGKNRGKYIHEGKIGKNGRLNSNTTYVQKYTNYPQSILRFKRDTNTFHPTQKPVDLFEYLVRTYSNEGGIVVDSCIGSGTTAIACINAHRHFIGFELNDAYFKQANERIKQHVKSNT